MTTLYFQQGNITDTIAYFLDKKNQQLEIWRDNLPTGLSYHAITINKKAKTLSIRNLFQITSRENEIIVFDKE